VPGRAVDVATGLLVQVAWASDGAIDELAARAATPDGAEPAGAAAPIGVLPASVALDEVVHRSRASAGRLSLCFALGDEDLGPACLEVREGEHVLVAGPSRAGVSTALAALAAAGRAAGAEVVALVGPRPGLTPLLPDGVEGTPHAVVADALDRLAGDRATVVVVDDAHDLEDGAGLLAAVLADPPTGLVVVAGGRADLLRAAYGHWTRFVRRSRVGILLQPTPELDGELLGVRLPRSAATSQAGRGVLVEAGTATTVQVAVPAPADGAGAAL
jgi:S-DNA-T family DNA segregation ATPase FtsK/SpoIIIE